MIQTEQLSDSNKAIIEFKKMREHYLTNANETIQKKEFRKASELLWGSITQTLKLLAATHNAKIYSHDQFRKFVREVAKEVFDKNLEKEFSFLETLHKNFYDEMISEEDFAEYYKKAIDFINKIDILSKK